MGVYSVLEVTIVLTIYLCGITKDISSIAVEAKPGNNIGECQRCKILTDSFSYWLNKTSRGKHEGGDAAWAETKLKNYAHSELRLIEIQEGLCSEVKGNKDECYALAEEAEQVLETWWSSKSPDSMDLYTWLCIDTLQNCCPQNHFGPSCSPCLLDENNTVCRGNGKCDGEGTRKGNGSCICNTGYKGEHCQDCAKNFYSRSGFCEACHAACDGCTSEGASSCVSCKNGWQLQSGSCVDINECGDQSKCKPDQFCINKIGSFTCKACNKQCLTCSGYGLSNCTSCLPDHELWEGYCVNQKHKSEILYNSLKRALLYTGLLLITFFIFRSYKFIASLVIVIIAIYIYFTEASSKFTVANAIKNILFS